LKLALSVDALTPVLTGIGRYAWELASRLPQHPQVEDVRYYRQGHWVKEPGVLLQVDAAHGRRAGLLRHLRVPRRLRERVLGWNCRGRVFHGPNYFLPQCADIGVATIHDLSVFKFPETHPLERIRHFEREFNNSVSRAAHLITDTEATRQEVMDFLSWPAEKISAVPLGVSANFRVRAGYELQAGLKKYGLTQDGYTLCVSTLEPRKKLGNLLQAYESMSQPVRDRYPLILVGGAGWLSESLHRDIDRCSGQGWLRYLGFIPESDLPVLYSGARAFVYPSIYEGFGLPVLEAMASGVPVVASNRSSLPEITKGAARLVDPDDIDALRVSIEIVLSDEAWRSTAKLQGLAVADGFSWDNCVDQTIRVYERIVP